MKPVSIFVAILTAAVAALGFAGAESESATEASAEGVAGFMELPIAGQAEYNLDDYVRLTGNAIKCNMQHRMWTAVFGASWREREREREGLPLLTSL